MNSFFTPTYINNSIPIAENTFHCQAFASSSSTPSYISEDETIYTKGSWGDISNNHKFMMDSGKPPSDEVGIGGGAKGNMVPLPLDYMPNDFDVLVGRGKKNYNSPGNQRLRRIVDSYVEQYSAATSRQDKSDILSAIVNEVRQASPNGGFVKQDPVSERWFEVGDFLAREKVSQAFRDALSFQYRSSKKFKHEKRRQRDKAAKLAKQKGVASGAPKEDDEEKEETKTAPRKSSSRAASEGMPLLKRQSLSVLREEPSMMSGAFVPPQQGQGNVPPTNRPTRAMTAGHAPSAAAFMQGAHSQPFGGLGEQGSQQQQQQQQAAGGSQPEFFQSFDSQGLASQPDVASMGTRHTSWPQLFAGGATTNPLFNPMAGTGISNVAAMSSQRRYSSADAGMLTDVNQAPFAQFHQSDPNPMTWSQQLQLPLQQGAGSSTMPPLNPSFPAMGLSASGGLPNLQPGSLMPTSGMSSISTIGTGGLPTTNPMAVAAATMPIQLQQQQPQLSYQRRQQQQQQRQEAPSGDRSSRRKSLERSASNVSTASASAIVAHLESSLTDLDNPDENPFEPVPLPGRRGNGGIGQHQQQQQQQRQSSQQQRRQSRRGPEGKSDHSILPDW